MNRALNATEHEWIEPATPRSAPNIRIMQLDVLRGLAVLGIYWINVIIFALPSGSYYLPMATDNFLSAEFMDWTFTEIFIEGTMRGLFSMLFGASAMVFLEEARLAHQGLDVVDRYYRRNLYLILFGLIHGYILLWPYDVLYAYGLLGLFLFPLRKLSSRNLLILGCSLLLVSNINLFSPVTRITEDDTTAQDVSVEPSPVSRVEEAREQREDQIKEVIDNNSESRHFLSSYPDISAYLANDTMDQQSSVMYTDHVFDIGGMMLLGMALLRLGIIPGYRSRRFYFIMMISGYLSGALFRGASIYLQISYDFDLFENSSHAGIDYDMGRVPITLGHIGLVALICKSAKLKPVTSALSAVGRLALTNYIMQTIISIFIFYGFGLGLFGKFSNSQVIATCLGVWLFQISFSLVWLKYFRHGPLEWLWRSLIYGRPQPLRKIPG